MIPAILFVPLQVTEFIAEVWLIANSIICRSSFWFCNSVQQSVSNRILELRSKQLLNFKFPLKISLIYSDILGCATGNKHRKIIQYSNYVWCIRKCSDENGRTICQVHDLVVADQQLHKVHTHLGYHSVCPLVGLGPSHPLSRKRVCIVPPPPPPPPNWGGPKGGGGGGGGGPRKTTGEKWYQKFQ